MQFNQLRHPAKPAMQCVMKSTVTTSIIQGIIIPHLKLSMWSGRGTTTGHGWPMGPGDELGILWRQFGNSREELRGFRSCLQMWGTLGSLLMKSHTRHGADLESLWWGAPGPLDVTLQENGFLSWV